MALSLPETQVLPRVFGALFFCLRLPVQHVLGCAGESFLHADVNKTFLHPTF